MSDLIEITHSPVSNKPTPWAVHCLMHGLVHLTREEYMEQMCRASTRWECPMCGHNAEWSDENYEEHMGLLEQPDEEGTETK